MKRYCFMSTLHYVFCCHFVILSAVKNYLLAALSLDFGGRFLGQHFIYDVVRTLDKVYMVSPPELICIKKCVRVCVASGVSNRMSSLIVRLPELKRANIEHCLIAGQVQQMTMSNVEMGTLWRELFLSAGETISA